MKHLTLFPLRILSIILILQLLNPPTSSYSISFSDLSPRRWVVLSSTSSSDDDNSANDASPNGIAHGEFEEDDSTPNLFEKVVRTVSKNKKYKFGDITRNVASSTSNGVEGVVRTVTKNDDYRFGDLTKNVVTSSTSMFENAVKSITKDERYKFGDLTKGTINKVKTTTGSVMTYSEKTLSLMREANIHEFVELLNYFWNNNMNYEERKEAFAVLVYLGAIIVLSYSFIANLMSGMVFAGAWTKVALMTGKSPTASGILWTQFLQTKASLDMIFGGPFLPARVAATIPWFFQYRKFVVGLAYLNPMREKYPILNRCVSLLTAWVFANLALVGGTTYALVYIGSLRTGVPMFPIS
mmetsp:Transcript_8464/g.17837  ORF Transcript_8464/g.17837 Transcript_8464/m.17837 type:complete len:354 (-) Transcript_8464:74-1135(-)